MHLRSFSLLALGAATASAFRDTSPFFLASTSEYVTSGAHRPALSLSEAGILSYRNDKRLTAISRILATSANLKTSPALLEDLAAKLGDCPSDYYVIASQPGVHSSDFTTRKAVPRLGAKMTGQDKNIRSTVTVNEVVGVLEAKKVQAVLEKQCGAESTVIDASAGSYPADLGSNPRVIVVYFPVLPLGSERAQQLFDNDGLLSDIIERIPSSKKYTILYTTSPREYDDADSNLYNSEPNNYDDPVHQDLKRDHSYTRRDESTNKSLFQEYQYFTPGIFMGLIASFVCLSILYVGLSALMSLQVPYAAFEKDTSASVQKKQQ